MPIIAESVASYGPTLDELITEIVVTAQGLAVAPDQMTTLRTAIGPTALSFTIDGDHSPGVFEIGDELVYVTAIEATSGVCTVHPRGRGWQGTTATDHAVGDVVVDGPSLPRHRVRTMLNDVISSLHPAVFGVGTVTDERGETAMVELPSDAEFVLDVRVDSDGEWERVRHWEAEMSSSATQTTKAVRLPRTAQGDTVQVVYGHRPERLTTAEQPWSDTGLSLGVKDLVVTGVLARYAQTLDMGRLTDRFSTPKGDTQQPQLGAGFAMSRQLKADFQAALDREALALRTLYPARSHFVR